VNSRTIVELFIPFTLAVMTFAMGLSLRGSDFRRVAVEPRAVLVGMFGQLVALPAIGFAIALGFALPAPLAVGLVILCAAPGGASSNLYSYLARADVALSVTLTALSGLVTIVSIPLVVNLALDTFLGTQHDVGLPVLSTMANLVLLVGLPLLIGMWIRQRRGDIADRLEKITTRISVILLATLILGAVIKERSRMATYFDDIGLPIILLSLSGIALGMLLASLARLSIRQTCTIGIEVGMQNSALAMGIALSGLGSEEMAMPAAIYAIVSYGTCGLVVLLGRSLIRPAKA
jgi:BASS family bile acid:Na+ symporter